MQLKLRFSLLFLGLLISPISWSTPTFNLGVGVDALYFDYREFNGNDVLLDKETGPIPGLHLSAALQWDNWYSELVYEYHMGTVDYEGQTQAGDPLSTETEEDIVDLSLVVGRHFGASSRYRSAVYAGLGYHYWERNILPTGTVAGLLETYKWSYALLGAKFSFLKSAKNGLLLDLRVRRMLDATMEVDFLGFMNWDNTELNLGEDWSYRVGLPYILSLSQNASLTIEPYISTWFIKRSDTREITSGGLPLTPVRLAIYEPRSETTNLGITFKYMYQF
ncbi:MAG: hypothetical protein OEU74_02210 [Gammaproteobacteria bacterium]|nr:hypothetical protein [Gammaproteobacteria bacterium]